MCIYIYICSRLQALPPPHGMGTPLPPCGNGCGGGVLLALEMSKKCTPLWREAHFEVKMLKTPGFGPLLEVQMSLRFTTLHYIALHSTTLHYTTLHYITTTTTTTQLHSATIHSTTLHYTALHYIPLHSTTLHYITLHYITLNDTAPQIDRWTDRQIDR